MFGDSLTEPAATDILLAAVIILFGLVIYFSPFIVAHAKDHEREASIFFANLTIGWTVIGWIVVWIWVLTTLPKATESGRRSLQPTVRTRPGSSPPTNGDTAPGKNREGTESKRRT